MLTAMLAGCSTLQIEVDVYKGALVNTKEIQLRQYASLANSAKPMLIHAVRAAKKEDEACQATLVLKNTSIEVKALQAKEHPSELEIARLDRLVKSDEVCSVTRFQQDFLCDTLNLYEDANVLPQLCHGQHDRERPEPGLDHLKNNLLAALSTPQNPDKELAIKNKRVLDEATKNFNQAMIFFAQRVLFYSNNQVLFKAFSQTSNDMLKASTPVLQTLGNTILVHANDLQRQESRDEKFAQRAASERNAIVVAYSIPPSLIFDRIVKALGETSTTVSSAVRANAREAEQQQALEAELTRAIATEKDYLAQVSPLLATNLTLVDNAAEAWIPLDARATELLYAEVDRKAVAALPLPTNQSERSISDGLQEWLSKELTSTDQTAPLRQQRLSFTQAYLKNEKAYFAAAKFNLDLIKRHISLLTSMAIIKLNENKTSVLAKTAAIENLEKNIARSIADQLAKQEEQKISDSPRTSPNKTIELVKNMREEVLKQAELGHIDDVAGVHALLKLAISNQLTEPKESKPNKPSPPPKTKSELQALKSTLEAVEQLPVQTAICPQRAKADMLPGDPSATDCGDEPIKIIDNLIASLRAQRIQALSMGAGTRAVYLLDAINAAHEQRTSLIYLRPASDYLRSVYSASAFQESAQKENRNILVNWRGFLPIFSQDNISPREQLEKLYWQNINKVSVSGGGNTNYVLAKDDVGNWYVKAYSADPEAIIKSATSLALFNSGKLINTNFLRRAELQRQIDDPKTTPTQAQALQTQLDKPEMRDTATLLKIKERHTARYREETALEANSLLTELTALPARLKAEIDIVAARSAACATATDGQVVDDLDRTLLETARTKLRESANAVALQEKAIQAGLKAMHKYGGELALSLATSAANCNKERAALAAILRDPLLDALASRKRSIERYEDGLLDLAAVADAK